MKRKKEISKKPNKYLFIFTSKLLISIALFLSFSILIKTKKEYKDYIYENVYNNTISFASIRSFYDKHFGNIFPSSKLFKEEIPVFSEKISYKEINKYKDGVSLTVDDKYLVPIIESGVVIFIGQKNDYGDTVIIQSDDNLIWYSNINISDIKLYDYLEKGSFIGEAKDEKIYLVFQRNGEFIDYKEFI